MPVVDDGGAVAVAVAVPVVVREPLLPDDEEDPDPDPDECGVVVVEEALPEMGGTPRRREVCQKLNGGLKVRYECSKEGSMTETHRRLWRSRCP